MCDLILGIMFLIYHVGSTDTFVFLQILNIFHQNIISIANQIFFN